MEELVRALPEGLVVLAASYSREDFSLFLTDQLTEDFVAALGERFSAEADEALLDAVPEPGVAERLHMAGPHEGHNLLRQREPGSQALDALEATLDGAGILDDGNER